jgi:hypothetical protein
MLRKDEESFNLNQLWVVQGRLLNGGGNSVSAMEALASALVSQSQAQLLARTFQQHRVSQEQRDGFLMRFKMSWLTWVLSHGEHSSDVLASRRGKPFWLSGEA